MLATVALIATAATVISCNKHLPDPELPQVTAIQFTTEDNWTKAIADESTLKSEGFRVWAWFTGATSGNAFGDNGTHVTYADNAWTYSPTRYWMNGSYDFFAVYPENSEVETKDKDFTITYNVDSQADLLVATPVDAEGNPLTTIDGGTYNSSVDLKFEHVLCQLEFKAISKALDLQAALYGIDIYASGSGTYSSANESWTNAPGTDKIYTTSGHSNLNGIEYQVVESGIMMIPQALNEVSFIIRYYGKDEDGNLGEARTEVFLKNLAYPQWESGKKYTYLLSVTENGQITFGTPIVTPWVNASGGSFIIPTPIN